MSDRGIKKWAPYKSLVEQQDYLNNTYRKKNVVEKPKISEERAEKINNILINYSHEQLEIKFYRKNTIHYYEIVINKIDSVNRCLYTDIGIIKFSEIIDLDVK